MNNLDVLEREFPGKVAWGRFCDCYSGVDQNSLNKVNADPDIAQVLISKTGSLEGANDWLSRTIPALDGHSAESVLTWPNGGIIVRSLIMKMP